MSDEAPQLVHTLEVTILTGGDLNGAGYRLTAKIEIQCEREYSESEVKFLIEAFAKDLAHGPMLAEIMSNHPIRHEGKAN